MTKLYHDNQRWQVPGQQGRGASREDVPSSPEQLAAWLNARNVPRSAEQSAGLFSPGVPNSAVEQTPALDASIAKARHTAALRQLEQAGNEQQRQADAIRRGNAEELAGWILDHATCAQVEQLFAAIGARFHELRKATPCTR